MVQSIFYATINEVTPEHVEQAHDFDKLLDECRQYMNEWGVTSPNLIHDLLIVLE